MHRCLALALTILALAVTVGANFPAYADEKDKFVGTWKLVSAVSEDLSTGEKTDIYKALAVGFITYSTDGRVMTITVNADRKKPVGAVATAPEAEALFRSMVAYAGTYTVKGNQVIHRPDASWNETWILVAGGEVLTRLADLFRNVTREPAWTFAGLQI